MKAKIKYLPVYEPFYMTSARYQLLYGGAGSGKSVAAAQKVLYRLGLPRHERCLAIRKGKVDLKDSVFEEIKNVIDDSDLDWKYHTTESPLYVKDKETGNDVIFRGLDDSKKIKSVSRPTFAWIEEMAEEGIDEDDFDQIDFRIRGENVVNPFVMGTFNPEDSRSWIRKRFPLLKESDNNRSEAFEEDDSFVMRTTFEDNPKRGEHYEKVMQRKEAAGGKFADVYVHGIWGNREQPDQLIKEGWATNAYKVGHQKGENCIGTDVARFGDDKTILLLMNGNGLETYQEYEKKDTSETTLYLRTFISDHSAKPGNVGIDTVGIGAGVYDQLKTFGIKAIEIKSGESPIEEKDSVFEFFDLRSQMWWHMREDLRNSNLCILEENQELIEELTTPKYEIRSGKKVKVESKKEIKKRLGRSTDISDAFVYANFMRKGLLKKKGSLRPTKVTL